MYDFIQKFHSGWAYLVLGLLIVAIVNSFIGMATKRRFKETDRKIALFALITTHIQLLIGFILYFISPLGLEVLDQMSNSSLRLTALEHPITNIISVALITVGWSKHKFAKNDTSKFKTIGMFFIYGLVLILMRLPWSNWLN